jgi:ArsR family transcriptional regulator
MEKNASSAEAMLKHFANAKRLLILCNLVGGEKSVGELAEIVGLSSSALSQHLAKLKGFGLVDSNKRGQMVYYHIASMEAQALLSTLYLIYCK